jgi:hypothetical protein
MRERAVSGFSNGFASNETRPDLAAELQGTSGQRSKLYIPKEPTAK